MAALCVCGSIYPGKTPVWHCTPAKPWESSAVPQHKTMGESMYWRGPLGASRLAGMGSFLWVEQSVWLLHCLSSWTPLFFLTFPQLSLRTGNSKLCPGSQLPLTTLGGNSFLSSSLVFSHIESQKVKKNLSGQPELDLFPFHVLIPLFNPQELHYKLTGFHPNLQTSTPKPQTLQTRLRSHLSHGPSQADMAQVGQLKVTGESSPCSWEYGEAPAAAAIPV